jgi:hypothetical protein
MAIARWHEAENLTEIQIQIEFFDDGKRFGSRIEPR